MVLNPLDLSGRSFLVTGASSGIGRAVAQLLSQLGARLLLAARNYDKLEQTRESLEGTGHRSESFDLSKTDDIESWLVSTAQEFGRLDGLVHSAGVLSTSPLRMLSRARIDAMLNVNLIAAIALTRAYCSRKVRTDHGGSIVLLASTMGLVGQPGRSAYAASKGGIVARWGLASHSTLPTASPIFWETRGVG